MEGTNFSWDELTCVGYEVTDSAVEKLCKDMKSFMLKAVSAEEKKEVLNVTKEQKNMGCQNPYF